MKTLLFLLSFASVNACSSEFKNSQTENVMQQTDIVNLVQNNKIEAVKSALKKGANVNTQNKNGQSLLLIATLNQQTEMAKLLVSHKADVNLQAENLDSAFLYAGASGQTELVKLFLENGAKFDVFNRYNGTALIPACERGHVETVKVLATTKDFPINHVNRLGWTALMEAVVLGNGSKKYQEIIQILKDNKADLSIPDKDGITGLQHAKEMGFKEIAAILES